MIPTSRRVRCSTLVLVTVVTGCTTLPHLPRQATAEEVKQLVTELGRGARKDDPQAMGAVVDMQGRFALAYAATKWASRVSPETTLAFDGAVGGVVIDAALCFVQALVRCGGDDDCLNKIEIARAPQVVVPMLPPTGPLADGVLTMEDFAELEGARAKASREKLKALDLESCAVRQLERVEPSSVERFAAISEHITMRWLNSVDGLFIAHLQCADGPAVALLTSWRDRSNKQLLGWHF